MTLELERLAASLATVASAVELAGLEVRDVDGNVAAVLDLAGDRLRADIEAVERLRAAQEQGDSRLQ